MAKIITNQTEWGKVSAELDGESLKLASYDHTLFPLLGEVKGQKILDYGCGPGVLALALHKSQGDVHGYDISEEMVRLCGLKIGTDRAHLRLENISRDNFDAAICNLVLCIVDEQEVKNIARNLKDLVREGGKVYTGFCNPLIFDVPESNLDFRMPTGCKYHENHRYEKIKKEGGYRIIEDHRPIEWYEQVFKQAGLRVVDKHFTPKYELNGKRIRDFILFEMEREK